MNLYIIPESKKYFLKVRRSLEEMRYCTPPAFAFKLANSSVQAPYRTHPYDREEYNVTNYGSLSNSNCIVKYNGGKDIILSPDEFHSCTPEKRINIDNSHYQNSPSNYKPHRNSLKKKRSRTTFTTEQIIALEEVFKKKPYAHQEERIKLMNRCQMSEKSIRVWFQNRRRLTDKRNNDYISYSPLSDDTSDTITDRLTLIETHIKQNTDENGFVTLDSEIMNSLVKIIDECLSQKVDIDTIVNSDTSDSKVIYEPISPVSLNENYEDMDKTAELMNQSAGHLGITDYYYF